MKRSLKNEERNKRISGLIRENIKLIDHIFKSFLDNHERIILIITDQRIEFANHLAIKEIGYSLKELIHKSLDELFITNQKIPFRSYLAITSTKRKMISDQIMVKVETKSGSEKWYVPIVKRCIWNGESSLLLILANNKEKVETSIVEDVKTKEALLSSNQGVCEVNYQTGEVFVSPECYYSLGYKPGEIKHNIENWKKIVHQDFWKFMMEIDQKIKSNQLNNYHFEFQILSKTGEYVWMQFIGRIVEWDSIGNPIRVIGVLMNIDERKKIEIEKDETRKKIDGLITHLNEGVMVVDHESMIIEWNPALEKITQIKRNSAIGRSAWEIYPALVVNSSKEVIPLETIKNQFKAIVFSGQNALKENVYETEIILSNGEKKILQCSIFSFETATGIKVALTAKDITESKVSRDKIEKNEERLKLALSTGKVGIWDIDLISGEVYFSPMVFQILGFLPWELKLDLNTWISLIHPEDRPFVDQRLSEFRREGTWLELIFRIKKKSSDYIWLDSKNKVLRNEVNEIVRITGTVYDITFRKEVELEQTRHKEELIINLARHELLSEISIILNTTEEFDTKINEVIAKLGLFTNTSRVYIFENSPDHKYTINTFEWCNKGVESQKQSLQEVSLDMILEWIEGKEYYISSDLIADMPPDLAEMMIAQGIQSCLIFPLYFEDKLFGFVGFDDCTVPHKWDKLEIEVLKTITNLISFAYERQKTLQNLVEDERHFREITDLLPHIVFDVTLTGRVEFLNKSGYTYFGLRKNDLTRGIFLSDLFKETDQFKISIIREWFKKASNNKPIDLEAVPVKKAGQKLKVKATPKLRKSGIVGFTGMAMLN